MAQVFGVAGEFGEGRGQGAGGGGGVGVGELGRDAAVVGDVEVDPVVFADPVGGLVAGDAEGGEVEGDLEGIEVGGEAGAAEVVPCLDVESSAPPDGAGWQRENFPNTGVTEHTYRLLGGTDVVNIYWADPGQQRNGLAIVTRESAGEVIQLPVHSDHNSRPIMGIRLGSEWYFTGHAHPGGADAEDMYETVRQYMAQRGVAGPNWRILGDFNTDPSRMPAGLQNRIIAAGQPTHQGGSELDFAMDGAPVDNTQRPSRIGFNSDHFGLAIAAFGLVIDNQGCRKRDLRCLRPTPGHTYRFFSASRPGSVIARDQDSHGPTLSDYDARDKSVKDSPDYTVQVRFSSQPDEYLLAFGDKKDAACIERSGHVTSSAPCNPSNEDQHWKIDGNRQIQDPDRTRYLAPGPNGLYTSESAYAWDHRTLGYIPSHDELKKRDDVQPVQPPLDDPDPGAVDDGAGDDQPTESDAESGHQDPDSGGDTNAQNGAAATL